MPDLALESIEIEGFLSIRSATVQLGPLNVLIGANGAGKSNLIRAFAFLGRLAERQLRFHVPTGGAAGLLNDRRERRIRFVVNSSVAHYAAELAPGVEGDLLFRLEQVELRGERIWTQQVSGDGGYRESLLGDAGEAGAALLRLFEGWRVFHFHDTSDAAPMKGYGPTADNLALHNDARNVAAVLLSLRDGGTPAKKSAYRRIAGGVRLVAPFFEDFVLEPEGMDEVRLRWRQVGIDGVFSAHQMSDGTLRFVCLATLLLQPELPALVVLDEPELGLHPFAIALLVDLLRSAATRSQVILATQSVTLINQLDPEELIVVDRLDGASVFRRLDLEPLAHWLTEYSLGELWEKNLLGGSPNYERRTKDA